METHKAGAIGLLLFVLIGTFGIGCEPPVPLPFNITSPSDGEITEGEVTFTIWWDSSANPNTFGLTIMLNGENVTDLFTVTESGATATFTPLPGRKSLAVYLPYVPALTSTNTLNFISTSTVPRDTLAGGLFHYQAESSFVPLPVSIQGLDMGLGMITDFFSDMLAMSGDFPSGDDVVNPSSTIEKEITFGEFVGNLQFGTTTAVPNAISIGPSPIGPDIPYDTAQNGSICGFTFDLGGFIIPVRPLVPGLVHAVATLDVSGMKLYLVNEGECDTTPAFETPADVLFMTINYTTTLPDAIVPVLVVTAPEADIVVNNLQVQVTGTVTDNSGADPVVTVNDNEVTVDSGTGAFSELIDIDGTTYDVPITIEAADAAGNKTTVERNIHYDAVAPVLTLTSPAQGDTVNSPTVTVSGTVSDDNSGSRIPDVTIDGEMASVFPGGFICEAVLEPESNTIEVIASDGVNETSETLNVTYSVIAPVLTILNPEDGTVTNLPQITFDGYATDASLTGQTVTINGFLASVTDYNFSGTVNLVDGPNNIEVAATIGSDNLSETREVIFDTVEPTLEVTYPPHEMKSGADDLNPIVVQGTVSDDHHTPPDMSGMTLSVNGQSSTVQNNGQFNTFMPLEDGLNTFTVVCSDGINEAEQTVDVFHDSEAPWVFVFNPFDEVTTSTEETINVIGLVLDNLDFEPEVTVNGETALLNELFLFLEPVTLTMGDNTIDIVVTDGINEVTVTHTVTRVDAE